MLSNALQHTRSLAVATPLPSDRLVLQRLRGSEGLSKPFEFELDLISPDSTVDLADLVGRAITARVAPTDEAAPPQYFHGHLSELAYVGQHELGTLYRGTLVPWLWFLSQTSDCRIFQNQSVPQIVAKIFSDLGFNDFDLSGLSADYLPREYCVQYRETDLNFVSRLLEDEGIFYFFRHEAGRHVMVLADSNDVFQKLPMKLEWLPDDGLAEPGEQIVTWRKNYALQPGGWAQTDYDFLKPTKKLLVSEATRLELPMNSALEMFEYPGGHLEASEGSRRTRLRKEEAEAQYDVATTQTTYRGVRLGGWFEMGRHRNAGETGRGYVITDLTIDVGVGDAYGVHLTDGEETLYQNRVTAIPRETPFRPRRLSQPSIVEGPQTATVVGPPGEEIYPDEHGRVKVQFHWDREGRRDENSSCWIRTSQQHAGSGWGTVSLPRIGEEVLVSFLDGSPDRPIIKGRVYNGDAKAPFALPAGKTRGGMKSQTHKGSGNNEITLDDTAGQEQIRVHGQFNMDSVVGNNETLDVGVDRTTQIKNNDSLAVTNNSQTSVGTDSTTKVGNNETVEVASNVVIDVGTAITLQCGTSMIHMNQAGVVSISGMLVSSIAKANQAVLAPLTEITGSQMLIQAGLVCLDEAGGANQINGSKQTQLSGAKVNIDGGMVVVKGAPIMLGEVGAPLSVLPPPSAAAGAAQSAANAAGGAGGGAGGSASDGPVLNDESPNMQPNGAKSSASPPATQAGVDAAKSKGVEMIDETVKALEDSKTTPNAFLNSRFGLDPSDPDYNKKIDAKIEKFQKARDFLSNANVVDSGLSDPAHPAFYSPSDPSTINLRDSFHTLSPQEQAETLIHESLHPQLRNDDYYWFDRGCGGGAYSTKVLGFPVPPVISRPGPGDLVNVPDYLSNIARDVDEGCHLPKKP
ncbi:MAG: type VI secretion system tip protein TssI/VgrG [Planctomycetota bacterium]|nr:type VI secretion system tip protein TssI/VgrG [Planctomycetota bacterium]